MAKNGNKKIPTVDRVEKKLKAKLESGASIANSAEFICASMRSSRSSRDAILSMAESINPMLATKAIMIDRELTAKKTAQKKVQNDELEKHTADSLSEEKNRIEWLDIAFRRAKEDGSTIRWGVTLRPDDRKLFFSPKETKEIIALRREKLSTYKVRVLLDCTLTEINRWDESGLLPHAFKQSIQAGGKSTQARFWLESEVVKEAPKLVDWRKSHELKKSFKRKNSPLKVVV
ncbi:MAG: hypothetical protein ACI90U_001005 [Pseudomonadales bacterium]